MKIIVLGGGFAGRGALPFLASIPGHQVTLIDRNPFTTMLPSIPDVAGGRVNDRFVTADLLRIVPDNVRVVQDTIIQVDFDAKNLRSEKGTYTYDYLVLAGGSTTNFYNFQENLNLLYKMDCIQDAWKLRDDYRTRLAENSVNTVVVVGCGFTGLEVACNLLWAAKKAKRQVRFVLVEKMAKVLPMLDEKTCAYVRAKMTKLGFEILTENEVSAFDGKKVTLKGGQSFENAMLVWTGGVKAALKLSGKHTAIGDGRVIVDETLRIPAYPEVFVAGDFAAFKSGEIYLRRTVNYASMMGEKAGNNLAALLLGGKLKPFRPFDPGWVIPLYITSVGEAFGIPVRGRFGIAMHYLITGFKNFSVRNLFAFIGYAIRFFFAKA
jgi:NADH dehydrogenase